MAEIGAALTGDAEVHAAGNEAATNAAADIEKVRGRPICSRLSQKGFYWTYL